MSLNSEDPNYYAHIYNESDSANKRIRILDSTLREGEQHPGISFTVKQRIQIAWMLDSFGVDQIEISPVVSSDHAEATRTIIKQGLKADILAHVRAIKSDVRSEEHTSELQSLRHLVCRLLLEIKNM